MPTWQTGLEGVIGFTDPWHAGAAAERHCAEQRNAPAFARALDRDDPIALALEATASLYKKATDRFRRTARNPDAKPDVPETWLAWRRDIPDLARAGPEAAELPSLGFSTVVLPSAAGGLARTGLPDPNASRAVSDVGDTPDRIRYVVSKSGEPHLDGRERPAWLGDAVELRLPVRDDEDGGQERCWVHALRRPEPDLSTGSGDVAWLGGSTQTLEEHGRRVGEAVRRIGQALGLPGPLVDALVLAGEWHDAGKSRRVWQFAAGVAAGAPALAKSRKGRFRGGWLGGYRHEFGSGADAERALPPDTPYRDLILHLIAAHHGWARPGFPRPEQWDPESPADVNRALAERIADRYARLSAEHGPWRLAWLESLLKSADAWVSSGRDA